MLYDLSARHRLPWCQHGTLLALSSPEHEGVTWDAFHITGVSSPKVNSGISCLFQVFEIVRCTVSSRGVHSNHCFRTRMNKNIELVCFGLVRQAKRSTCKTQMPREIWFLHHSSDVLPVQSLRKQLVYKWHRCRQVLEWAKESVWFLETHQIHFMWVIK